MKKITARDIAYTAAAAALMTVCSWLTVPYTVPFTMQTFAVSCSLVMLGGRKGTAAILLHILMGMAGLPVFSGFRGGVGHLLGPTGGYILGFVLSGLCWTVFEKKLPGKKAAAKYAVLLLGLVLCYLAGTLWFTAVYARRGSAAGFVSALSVCVAPYVLPDLAKLALALYVGERVRRSVDFGK
ncbi:MAG: biotin transporter BioY [Oscillospiraceae bacterium]|nr:biotin transporter BioY [Oscillospiraceae bacterium]